MDDVCEPLWEELEVCLPQIEEEERRRKKKKKERTQTERLEPHKDVVGKLLDSAEGRAGMLHHITMARPWRGGAQIIEDVFDVAQPQNRVEVNRQEWKSFCRFILQNR